MYNYKEDNVLICIIRKRNCCMCIVVDLKMFIFYSGFVYGWFVIFFLLEYIGIVLNWSCMLFCYLVFRLKLCL